MLPSIALTISKLLLFSPRLSGNKQPGGALRGTPPGKERKGKLERALQAPFLHQAGQEGCPPLEGALLRGPTQGGSQF